jgi:deoxyribodipyrimidine photo-lyase
VQRWALEHRSPTPPEPIVDLGESRKAALDAFDTMKRTAQS